MPWRANIPDKVKRQIDTLDEHESSEVRNAIESILANPGSPHGLRRETAGQLFDRRDWPRYQVSIPGVGSITYAIIEHAPPSYFKVITFDSLTTIHHATGENPRADE